MRKLRLDVDALRVDTFDVEGQEKWQRGTVRGAAPPPDNQLPPDETTGGGTGSSTYFSCTTPYATNEYTCQGSCGGTCVYTCTPPPGVLCA